MLTFTRDQLDSTSDEARRLAALHPGERLLVVARQQSAGRGRSGRTWQSPPGGAWFSIVWPASLEAARYEPAPLVVGLAVRDTIATMLDADGDALELKWPNDVLLRGGKVAGVLCERIENALIVGVGINVNVEPTSLGDALRFPATSVLAATGQALDVADVVQRCSRAIEQALETLEQAGLTPAMLTQAHQHLAWRGRPVALQVGQRHVVGRCVGIDEQGRLQLAVGDAVTSFAAGEVHAVRPEKR